MTDAKTLTTQLADAFETRTRDSGEAFVCLKEGSPQWMVDVVRGAHGDMLPDDTRYKMIREVVSCLTDRDPDEWDDSDTAHEICDSLVDIYTSARHKWLASHVDREAYIDDAVKEYGAPIESVSDAIAWGQYREYEEIYWAVVSGINTIAESEDDE